MRALVRSPEEARGVLPDDVELSMGDVTDAASVRRALAGCSMVYHAAGLPEQWRRDAQDFVAVNVEGTRHVVEAALEAAVRRLVYTSTIDVFAGQPGEAMDESLIDPRPKGTHYERSKQAADRVVTSALDRGLPAVFLHPSAVFGPGPARSPGLNKFFADVRGRRIPLLLPGTMQLVYGPDLGEGHVLAEERAPIGGRYILCESTHRLAEVARAVVETSGEGRIPPVLPVWIGWLVSSAGEALALVTGGPPLIPAGQLHFLQWGVHPSATRARQELGWRPTPFREALRATLEWQAAGEPLG